MNILNLEATYFALALKKQGHNVITAGFGSDCDICCPYPRSALQLYKDVTSQGFIPDAVIAIDNGNLPCFPGIEKIPCPSIFYTIDTFCNPWHVPYGYAFDHILVAQKDFVPLFSSEGLDASWMPLFAHHHKDICTENFSDRSIPIIFVGTLKNKNLPQREPFLRAFQQNHPLIIKQGNYVPLYNRSRIALNATAASEVNFRCFEAMACGCVLLMEDCQHGLKELFTENENILPFYQRNNHLQAIEITRNALNNPLLLAKIAEQGHAEVYQKHMDTHRAKHITDLLAKLIQNQKHNQRLNALEQRKHFLSTAYAILALELDTPNLKKHAQHYGALFNNLKK